MPVPCHQALHNRWILHFTHADNIAAIVECGQLKCDVLARDGLTRTEVGDPDIKESRRRRAIPVGPGGQVGDYVPFYFAPRSPMMYRIACDHRDMVAGRYADCDRPLVYLGTTIGAVVEEAVEWVATDGNAATATTEFTADVSRSDAMVDWPLMMAGRWNNTPDDPDRQRRLMAEFLVHRQLPLSLIRMVGTYSEEYRSQVRAALGNHVLADQVYVRPGWYYGYERRG
jgi:hypothetical protein